MPPRAVVSDGCRVAPELAGRVAGNRRRLGELAAPGEPGSLL
jgi:hypothetical protein